MNNPVEKSYDPFCGSQALSLSTFGIQQEPSNIVQRIMFMDRMSVPDYINVLEEGIPFGSVLTSHGQLLFSQCDLCSLDFIPIMIVRTYYSRNSGNGDKGSSWMFNFFKYIYKENESQPHSPWILKTANGTRLTFRNKNQNGYWFPPQESVTPYAYMHQESSKDKIILFFQDKSKQYFIRKSGIYHPTYTLQKIEDEMENSIVIHYNEQGEVIRIESIDENGNEQSHVECVYAKSHLIAVRQGLREIRYVYNEDGNITQCMDIKGNISKYSYDSKQRIRKIRYRTPDASYWIVFHYDSKNRVKKLGNLSGYYRFKYDDSWCKTIVTDPENKIHVFYYDTPGRTVRIVRPRGEIILLSSNQKENYIPYKE